MGSVSGPQHSFAAYLLVEESSGIKHEYLDGSILAMAGGTPEHAALAAKVIVLLGSQLAGRPCRVFSSDLRVRVLATGLATYPDVTVVCGPLETDPESDVTATNPVVLVEVTSPSTAAYDRSEKLAHYQRIPSLQEVVLVSHEAPAIDVFRRVGERWTSARARTGQTAELESIEATLVVDEVYRDPLE